MATADNRDSKLLIILVLLFLGINGLLSMLAEKAYQSIGEDSAYFFTLNQWVSASFTVVVFAILSGFVAQFGSFRRCLSTFGLLLLFKLIFSSVTAATFYFVGPYQEAFSQATSAALFSSLPAAIIHIIFAFITMLFLKPFSSGDSQGEPGFEIEMPTFDMPKMDAARPRIHSAPELTPAGEDHELDLTGPDHKFAAETKTQTDSAPADSSDTTSTESTEQEDGSAEPPSPEPKSQADDLQDAPAPVPIEIPTPVDEVSDVEITLADLVDQIDARSFTCTDNELKQYSFRVDLSEIIPQLSEGKITIAAEQALATVPGDILRTSPLDVAKKLPEGKIVLPLNKVIPQLRREVFSLPFEQQSELVVDDIPDPFAVEESMTTEESGAGRIVHSIPDSAAPELQAEPEQQQEQFTPGPEPVTPQPEHGGQPAPEEAAAQADTAKIDAAGAEAPESIQVNLAYIISHLPENSLGVTFSELQSSIENPGKLAVPSEMVIPQIQTGKVTLSAEQILSLFPPNSISKTKQELAEGLPEGGLELPLKEILEQLPAQTFHVSHEAEPSNLDEIPDVFIEPDQALSQKTSAVEQEKAAPSAGTIGTYRRFLEEQDEEPQPAEAEEQPQPQATIESAPIQLPECTPAEGVTSPPAVDKPADQVASLMSSVESALPPKPEVSEHKPAEPEFDDQPKESAAASVEISKITDCDKAQQILGKINQASAIFKANLSLYRFQSSCMALLVSPGIDELPLATALPETVSSLARFTSICQIGELRRIAFVAETGAVNVEFLDSPADGRWVLLADNSDNSLGVLFNYSSSYRDNFREIFDATGIESPLFTPVLQLEDIEQQYRTAGSLTAGLNLDFTKRCALSRTGGFHWEIMQKETLPSLDQTPESFVLLEPILNFSQRAGWGKARLILVRTEQAVLALTQPKARDSMCLLLGYPSETVEGKAVLEAARIRSAIERCLR